MLDVVNALLRRHVHSVKDAALESEPVPEIVEQDQAEDRYQNVDHVLLSKGVVPSVG
jgi:hypothetical protein